jgi:hypothetical protein
VACLVEDLVGFMRGEAFVPEVDGELCEFAQLGGEGLDLCSLRVGRAIEAERIADDDPGNVIAAAEASEGAEVFAEIAAALQGQHRLRCEAKLVGDGHANAPGANVEREIARWAGLVGHGPSSG